MKKRLVCVSSMVICLVMLITSLSVLAATKTESVGLDAGVTGTAEIGIASDAWSAWASTRGVSLYNDIIRTTVTGYGSDSFTGEGVSDAEVSGRYAKFTYAGSTHKWTGRSHSMTIYP